MTPTPIIKNTRRGATKTTQRAPSPPPLIKTPQDLVKYLKKLTGCITNAINRNQSTTSEDKSEIRQAALDIENATSFIINVMDPQTVVTNIDADQLMEKIREELNSFKVEMKCVSQLNATDNADTYASKASKAIKRIKTPLTRPAIVISATNETLTQTEVINTWHNKVSFKDSTFAPARIQPVSNNKVRIEFDDAAQRDATVSKLKSVKDLKFEEAKRRRPMMIIKGINKSVESNEIIELIKRQNPSVGALVASENDARLCFLRNNRSDKLFNAIIEVSPKIRVELLTLGRVNIDHQRVHVSDFSPFLQCYKCLQFGHTKAKCTSSVEPCSHCASTGHSFKECPDVQDTSKARCYNCHQHNVKTQSSDNDAHSATSMRHCPRIKSLMKRITERVDYGH